MKIVANPIHIGKQYAEALTTMKHPTYEKVAKRFHVSRTKAYYHIALVRKLPPEFVTWLENCEDREILETFAEFRLRPVAQLRHVDVQWKKLADLFECVELKKLTDIKAIPSALMGLPIAHEGYSDGKFTPAPETATPTNC